MAQVSGSNRRNQYTASAGQTTFTYTFKIYQDDDISVYNGTTLQTLTTDYTVTDAGEDAGGTVVLTTGATNGDIITLVGNTTISRETTFTNGGDFSADAINDEYDKLDDISDELTYEINTANVKVAVTDQGTVSNNLPTASANKCLVWNAAGTALENSTYDPDQAQTDAAAYATNAYDNAVVSQTNATAALASATAAESSATAANTSALDAASSATDAANSATAASTAVTSELESLTVDITPATTQTRNLGNVSKTFAESHTEDVHIYGQLKFHYAQSTDGVASNIYPSADSTYKLGDASYAWSNVYTDSLVLNGTTFTSIQQPKAAHYTYTVAQNTSGGATSAGAYTDRPINTEEDDDIGISLASNTLTIPAGTYLINAIGTCFKCGNTLLSIYDSTNTTTLLKGPTAATESGVSEGCMIGVQGMITLSGSTDIKVRQFASATNVDGMGNAINSATLGTETYLNVTIIQLS